LPYTETNFYCRRKDCPLPGYKGHLAGGFVAGGITVSTAVLLHKFTASPMQLAAMMSFCLLGALFPDTDTDSKGQNLFYTMFLIVDGALIYRHAYQLAAWLGFFAMLPALGHHRGWTHTWPAMLLVGSPILVVPAFLLAADTLTTYVPLYLAFTLGYFSHLLLDRVI
jgi:membrane-bound metal-dependent hydrolase YbcI (DUF457 family)